MDKKMKGKDTFTEAEINKLKGLIKKRCEALSSQQKAIRNRMRAIGFYGRDDFGINDMTIEKFEGLIKSGRIKIVKDDINTSSECCMMKKQVQITSQEGIKESFPPLVDEYSEILILGTMPGDESLRINQYYASPNNSFWKIMSVLFNEGKSFQDYEEKVNCLKKNHVALWDVFSFCEREGSADSNIQGEKLNDIEGLLKQYPHIKKIVFNGQKAAKSYTPCIAYAIAESTSNANAKKMDVKVKDWKTKLQK